MKTMSDKQHGVRLDENLTTMDVPHRKFQVGRTTYYVATFPEGDLAIHEWYPGDQQGYGASSVTFLMENGSYETVRGPFECQGFFDHGRREELKNHLGPGAEKMATRIVLGLHLHSYSHGPREEFYAEPALTCDPFQKRLEKACSSIGTPDQWPEDLGCAVYCRGGIIHWNRKDLLEKLADEDESEVTLNQEDV